MQTAVRSMPLAGKSTADVVPNEMGPNNGLLLTTDHGMESCGSLIFAKPETACCRCSGNKRVSRSDRNCNRVSIASAVVVVMATVSLLLSSIGFALATAALIATIAQGQSAATEGLALHKTNDGWPSSDLATEDKYSEPRDEKKDFLSDSSQKERNQRTDSRPLEGDVSKGVISRTKEDSSQKDNDGTACECVLLEMTADSERVASRVSGAEESRNVSDLLMEIVKWSDEDYFPNTACRDGRLVVPQDGIYVVYCQLYIIIYPQDQDGDENRVLRHRVLRQNRFDSRNGKVEEIMERSWTVTWSPTCTVVESSSFLAGVFFLKAEDEITIQFSNDWLLHVHHDSKTSFFGIFRLGPGLH